MRSTLRLVNWWAVAASLCVLALLVFETLTPVLATAAIVSAIWSTQANK